MKNIQTVTGSFLTSAVLAFGSAACGGGGGGGGGSSDAGDSSGTITSAPTTATPQRDTNMTQSTRLDANPAGSNAVFENFVSTKPVVPVSTTSFSGLRTYVKLERVDGEVLFLGEVANNRDFVIPVHVPLNEDRLLFEIFSDSPADQIVFGEIQL